MYPAECPNVGCGGEVELIDEQGENGPYPDGHYVTWTYATVAEAACNFGCELTKAQVKEIEADATEALSNYEPIID